MKGKSDARDRLAKPAEAKGQGTRTPARKGGGSVRGRTPDTSGKRNAAPRPKSKSRNGVADTRAPKRRTSTSTLPERKRDAIRQSAVTRTPAAAKQATARAKSDTQHAIKDMSEIGAAPKSIDLSNVHVTYVPRGQSGILDVRKESSVGTPATPRVYLPTYKTEKHFKAGTVIALLVLAAIAASAATLIYIALSGRL